VLLGYLYGNCQIMTVCLVYVLFYFIGQVFYFIGHFIRGLISLNIHFCRFTEIGLAISSNTILVDNSNS